MNFYSNYFIQVFQYLRGNNGNHPVCTVENHVFVLYADTLPIKRELNCGDAKWRNPTAQQALTMAKQHQIISF